MLVKIIVVDQKSDGIAVVVCGYRGCSAANASSGARSRTWTSALAAPYDAALRNLRTLSAATRHLPDELKASFREISWQEISGFRNILVHNDLGSIDAATVARVVERELGTLDAAVRKMLDS